MQTQEMREPRLGILGGMGPQATQTFYQRIIDRTEAHRDQEHVPALIWSDSQVPDRTAALLAGEGELVYARLLAGVRLLETAGCTILAVPCNTSHYFLDRLQGRAPPHPQHAPPHRGAHPPGRQAARRHSRDRRNGADGALSGRLRGGGD